MFSFSITHPTRTVHKIINLLSLQLNILDDLQLCFYYLHTPLTKKATEFQKNIYFCFIDYAKAFDFVDHSKLWESLKEMECQNTLLASWEICMQVKKEQ